MSSTPHLYSVALFDILGFEARFGTCGLEAMAEKYDSLIGSVINRNQHMSELATMLHMEDEATWTAEGDAFVCNRIYGAYASDTLLIWAHTLFPQARGLSDQERIARSSDPTHGWAYLPIPCDRFLEACGELVCEALELELPVRGAIAKGMAIMDLERGVFLGQPIIDAARMEKDQKLIGASLCGSYLSQVIPGPYAVPLESHVKEGRGGDFSGLVLNWPRHWRITRRTELASFISRLNVDPDHSWVYDNSLELNRISQNFADKMHTDRYVSTRQFYPQFASPKLEMEVRAVCRATPPNKSLERSRDR